MFKVYNKDSRHLCIFIVDFAHILHIFSVSITVFEQANIFQGSYETILFSVKMNDHLFPKNTDTLLPITCFQINPKISRRLDIAKKNNISENVYVKEIFLIVDTPLNLYDSYKQLLQ